MLCLTSQTTAADTTGSGGAGTLGPYVQSFPTNPVNGWSTAAAAKAANVGWVYTTAAGNLYTVQATDTAGANLLTY